MAPTNNLPGMINLINYSILFHIYIYIHIERERERLHRGGLAFDRDGNHSTRVNMVGFVYRRFAAAGVATLVVE